MKKALIAASLVAFTLSLAKAPGARAAQAPVVTSP